MNNEKKNSHELNEEKTTNEKEDDDEAFWLNKTRAMTTKYANSFSLTIINSHTHTKLYE